MLTIGVSRFSKSMIPFDFKVKIQLDLKFSSAMTAMLLLDGLRLDNCHLHFL